MHYIHAPTVNGLWLSLLNHLLNEGDEYAPRGQVTLEVCPLLLVLDDSLENIITVPERNLNYSFMMAEWFWMMAGRDDVESIAHYNKQIARFSDDGQTYFGAYGPKIIEQWDYVVRKLKEDWASRQAVLTIWRPNPPGTRDVPCTVAMQFLLRDGKLITNVTMRSSDAWLGIPYDVFNFSRTQALLAAQLDVVPGQLSICLGSSHIYEQHFEPAQQIVKRYDDRASAELAVGRSPLITAPISPEMFRFIELNARTKNEIINDAGPWTDYAEALVYRNHRDASLGDGHVMRIVRDVARRLQLNKEMNHVTSD